MSRTKEEILNSIIGEVRAELQEFVWYKDALKAMQQYADQQSELAFEAGREIKVQLDWFDKFKYDSYQQYKTDNP